MAATFPETDRTRAAWALFWTVVRKPWKDAERTEHLAEDLGPSRTAIAQWCTGADGRMGPWSMLFGACRLTGETFPERVPGILRKLGKELFGVECRVDLAAPRALGDLLTEMSERDTAWAGVLAAKATGNRQQIEAAVAKWLNECGDVGRVVELEAK